MSAASAASQMRVLCSRSSARKLGSPVKREAPAQPKERGDEQDQSRAQPVGFGRRPAEAQSPDRAWPPVEAPSRSSSTGPRQKDEAPPGSSASSRRRSVLAKGHVPCRMRPHSDCSALAPRSTPATLPKSQVHACA
jgi:hypothetical protein